MAYACPQKRREALRRWRAANPDKVKESNRKRATAKREWAQRNREKTQASKKRWREDNKDYHAAYTRSRKKRMKQATPSWLTPEHQEAIDDIYDQRDIISQLTGVEYHVDHIVPLKGARVWGLHVPWNLQLLPADENRRKNNNW